MTLTVKGTQQVHNQLMRKCREMPLILKEPVKEIMEDIAEEANKNLLSKIGGDRTPRGYAGHGDPLHKDHLADDVDDMSAWEIEIVSLTQNGINVRMSNTCEHAAAVEFGVPGTIKPKGRYLVLGYEGGIKNKSNARLAKEVKGQKGYSFLSETLNNQAFLNRLNRKLNILIMRRLRL